MAKLKNKKISEKLLQLVKPYLRAIENARTEQRLSSLLLIGSTAWNIEITGDKELKKILLNIFEDGVESNEVDKMIDNLTQRKHRLFPDDDRIIVDCKVESIKRKKYDINVSFLYKNDYEKNGRKLNVVPT
jgi:hypothetical protein